MKDTTEGYWRPKLWVWSYCDLIPLGRRDSGAVNNTLHTEAYSPQAVSGKGHPSVYFISISHDYSKDVSTSFLFLLLSILYAVCVCEFKAQPGGSDGTEFTSMQDTQIQSLVWEDSPGGGNDNPPQCSCHGQRSLVGYTVHRVAKSWTQLSD